MAERVSWSRGGSGYIPPFPPLPGASLQGISTRGHKPQPSIPAGKLLENAEKLQFLAGELLGAGKVKRSASRSRTWRARAVARVRAAAGCDAPSAIPAVQGYLAHKKAAQGYLTHKKPPPP